MATFKTQIEDLTGSVGDDSGLTQWLTDGAKELINLFPPKLKEKCSKVTNLYIGNTNTTFDMDDSGDILHVTRENADSGYYAPCRKIPSAYGDMSNDSGNMMHYASATDPVYWVESNSSGASTLFVKPTPTANQPAKVVYVSYPSVAHGDSLIANFPNEAEYLVVLYASVKALQRLMNDTRSSLPSDVSSITLATTSTSLPTYTAPSSFVLPAPPAGADVDNLPSIPVPPSLSSNSVSFSTSAPTYTGPVVAPDFSDANTWLNTEEDSEMVSSRVQVINAQMQEYSAKVQDAVNRFNKENAEYQAQLQISTQDAQLSQNDDAQKLQKYQAELTSYNAELSKALQVYQAETGYDMSKYQADVQANLQKYQSDLSKEQSSFNSNLQKYQAAASKVSSDNQTTISKFGQDVSNYNAKIQKLLTDYQWYQSQYAQLKQDYQQGIQILSGGGMSQAQKGGK